MSRELVDLDRLPKKMRDRLSSALRPEERLVVSIKGIGGALLATDRQILLWQRNTLTSYPLTSVSAIEWSLSGFNKWLRIEGDGLEEERPTFRNLPTRKHALGIGQTPKEQRDALSQLVGTGAPRAVVAPVDASAPHLDVTPPQQQAPIEQPPTAESDAVLQKDSVNDRGGYPHGISSAEEHEAGRTAQIAARVGPGHGTLDPLATGPKDLAEDEALRQAHLGPKRPIEKDTKVPQFVSEFTLPDQQGLPAGHDAASRAALERSQRELERARIEKDTTTLAEYEDSRRVRLSKRPSFGQAFMAAVRVGNAKAAEDRRARNALKNLRPRRKSAVGPLLIAVIAGIAFIFSMRGQSAAPATVTATPASAWAEYVARTAAWTSVIAADARALSSDGRAYDTAALSGDARTLKADAESYGGWLTQHGFLSCYHTVWTASLTAAAAYVQAGTAAARWADAAPNGNPNDLAAATNFMNEGSSSLDQATGLLQTVSCP